MNSKIDNQFKPVNLPSTSFAMKANLTKLEPELIKYFQEQKIWEKIRESSVGRKKFILHDGPPYANGNLHLGHALNKILKDIVCRTQQKLGYDADYVPGWDCHGLPIEWKIEESYREKKISKEQINIARFRNDCKSFAKKWVAIQKQQFIRLGVFGDFDNAYLTMDNKSQARIVEEIGKFLMNGSLYQGLKPVLWSVAERTALAEAEVEYKDVKSKSIFVSFEIVEAKIKALLQAKIIIWTTTPWTIPANRMLAGNKDLEYVIVEIEEASADSYLSNLINSEDSSVSSLKIVLAKSLLLEVMKICRVTKHKIVAKIKAEDLEGIVCRHPFTSLDKNYDYDIPLVFADFVDDKQGSGFVHIAPSHGQDDYLLAKQHNIKARMTLDDYGRYTDSIPLFSGIDVYDEAGGEGRANDIVIEHLEKTSSLLGRKIFKHSYPHSWRSKTPLLFRVTPQWFIALDDKNQIRKKALNSLKDVKFLPATGYSRLKSMIELRPDWCISRQRVWGVPLPIFINKKTKLPLRDQKVINRIKNIFIKHSADAWFNMSNSELLDDKYDPDDFEKTYDVVDVWFDSGCSHAFVLKDLMNFQDKADLYLEGSDQHRGWFQSSLLESAGTNNQAPYKAILTNGFVVDEKGHKLSKSVGNIDLELSHVINKYGAEIVRLWAISSNYYDDLRIGQKILNQQVDTYRRFRNSIRWLLGNVPDFYHKDLKADLSPDELPTLEQLILHKLYKLNLTIKKLSLEYSLSTCLRLLFDFCNNDLSAFYFDIRKDCLYCDDIESEKRKKVVWTIAKIFDHLTLWLAPYLPFTTQEAWLTAYPKDALNLHIKDYPENNESFINSNYEKKWLKVLDIRKNATILIEEARNKNLIKSSLEAKAVIKAQNLEQINGGLDLDEDKFAEILIVSDVEFILDKKYSDEQIEIIKASGSKCPRCWQIKPEVASLGVCKRCSQLSVI